MCVRPERRAPTKFVTTTTLVVWSADSRRRPRHHHHHHHHRLTALAQVDELNESSHLDRVDARSPRPPLAVLILSKISASKRIERIKRERESAIFFPPVGACIFWSRALARAYTRVMQLALTPDEQTNKQTNKKAT